jgi:peptidoglycan/LPS O-acetylase OafA/YrhL
VLWQYLATAAGFTLILDAALTAAPNPFAWLLSRQPLAWLGKVSYGLYVYHLLSLDIGLLLADQVQRRLGASRVSLPLLQVGISLTLTVIMAAFSYSLLESYFLRMKQRFSHVRSGPASQESAREGRPPRSP